MLGPVLVIFWPQSLNFFHCVVVCLGSLADTPTVPGGRASLSARITLTFDRKRQPFGCFYSARLPHSAVVGQVLSAVEVLHRGSHSTGVTRPVVTLRVLKLLNTGPGL